MRTKHRFLGLVLLPGILAATPIMSSCMVHHGYDSDGRYYDRDHRDYHAWNGAEVVFYQRWENDNHRDHREFDQRNADEQRDYWRWRHSQP